MNDQLGIPLREVILAIFQNRPDAVVALRRVPSVGEEEFKTRIDNAVPVKAWINSPRRLGQFKHKVRETGCYRFELLVGDVPWFADRTIAANAGEALEWNLNGRYLLARDLTPDHYAVSGLASDARLLAKNLAALYERIGA